MTPDEAFRRVRALMRDAFPDRPAFLEELERRLAPPPAKGGERCWYCGRSAQRPPFLVEIVRRGHGYSPVSYGRWDPSRPRRGLLLCSACIGNALDVLDRRDPDDRVLADVARAVRASSRPREEELLLAIERGLRAPLPWRLERDGTRHHCIACDDRIDEVLVGPLERTICPACVRAAASVPRDEGVVER